MASSNSKRLVIDASVASSSGGEHATFPTSKKCRDCLKVVLKLSFRITLSPEIHKEWKDHQSNFARGWLVQMYARKLVHKVDSCTDNVLRSKIEKTAQTDNGRDAFINRRDDLRKDIHLVEAALATDKSIIAMDEIVRKLFRHAPLSVGELRDIVWINPDVEAENCIEWLTGGAKPDAKRYLGHQ